MLCNSPVPMDITASIRMGKRRMIRVSGKEKNSRETRQRGATPGLSFPRNPLVVYSLFLA